MNNHGHHMQPKHVPTAGSDVMRTKPERDHAALPIGNVYHGCYIIYTYCHSAHLI